MAIEILGKGKFIELVKDGQWEFARRTNTSGAVAIVPLLKEKGTFKVIFVSQRREAVKSDVIEWPAGLVGDVREETESEAAMTELLEETGYCAGNLEFLAKGPPSPGMSDEVIAYYLATDLTRIQDAESGMVIHIIPLKDVHKWLDTMQWSGWTLDPKLYGGLYFINRYLSQQPKLRKFWSKWF